ncbi:MAG: ATP-binding protein [Gemmatimonadetes bacterium]|nr:ATP-binding protein [Gemmatimonadota bacterium]MYA64465.1 ATP-binding protein [Gemmatimonadota bacterium]MYB98990.1 ATP-binding protein [Gemmatimonadota bacterium]MYH54427.1 ATP-binding protein [Gemmatimonadota bacterium]MYI44783.1 ATP-binding protein [Gemmatimonadota bacterium]
MTSESLSFRPYARLLTMLGEQLIKNERIALVELIRNAYDADAEQVDVRFEDFNDDMTPSDASRIVVQDNGTGMTVETLRSEWMNPATPRKYVAKRAGKRRTALKKRAIIGEKGIGRFAVLKLGRRVTITTRPPGAEVEAVLQWDFSRFDPDFVTDDGHDTEVFLDEIAVAMVQNPPTRIPGDEHGTVIEIEQLNGSWGWPVVRRLSRDVFDLTDPVSRITEHEADDRMDVSVFCNGTRHDSVDATAAETLKALIEDKAVLRIEGTFACPTGTFSYRIGEGPAVEEIALEDPKIAGLWVWRSRFGRGRGTSTQLLLPVPFSCGTFSFHFYIFDFARGLDGTHSLTQKEKNLIKGHRIYLYRDGVRVYPYGDPDDDWLAIDVTRGTGRAGNFFSNDQIVGWIDIGQEENPNLRDKTNREGLIETGGAAHDLIFLVQVFLSYIKQYPFARYRHRQHQRSTARLVQDQVVPIHLTELRRALADAGHRTHANAVQRIERDYHRERKHLVQRAEISEDLAGVGLSVEMASHDIMLLLERGRAIARELAQTARLLRNEEISEMTDRLIGVLQQVVDGMRDVQTLFKSSRRRRKRLKVEPLLKKIYRIYKPLLDARNVRYRVVSAGPSPLVASTTDGVLMQVFINLFDNSAYWLETVDPDAREIRVTADSDRGELLFSDSGPGIDPEDLPYIFDAFYSGKGQEGRGLGLYIARQLLARHDYRIFVAQTRDRVLSGANFVVSFAAEDRS